MSNSHADKQIHPNALPVFLASTALVGTVVVGSATYFLLREDSLLNTAISVFANRSLPSLILFSAAYVLSCVLLLPAGLLTPLAGLIFGFSRGLAVISLGATCGALAAFLVGHHFFRKYITQLVRHDKRFETLDREIERHGWKIIFLARLCALVPFRLSNYLFSVSNISIKYFVIATWLGTLPSATFYVYLGSVAGNVHHLREMSKVTPLHLTFYALTIIVGGLLLAWGVYFARAALEAVQEKDAPE